MSNKLADFLAHDFCIISKYCRRCGQHRELVLHRGQPCLHKAQEGVVSAMSHLRAVEIGDEITATVISEMDDEALQSPTAASQVHEIVDALLKPIHDRLERERSKLYDEGSKERDGIHYPKDAGAD